MGYPLPDGVPDRLEPLIYAASLEIDKKFPRPNQAKQRIKSLTFAFAEIIYMAAKNDEIAPHLAVDALRQFVRDAHLYDAGLPKYLPTYYEKTRSMERFETRLANEIEESDEWREYIDKFAALVRSKISGSDSEHRTTPIENRKTLRDAYLNSFPEKIFIRDICWAVKQRYREWTRWIGGHVKDGSKPDKAFRAIMTSGKRPEQYRADPRPKDWK
jgi:hypothetical protein